MTEEPSKTPYDSYREEVRAVEREFRVATKPLREKLQRALEAAAVAESKALRESRALLRSDEASSRSERLEAERRAREKLAIARANFRSRNRAASSNRSGAETKARYEFRQAADPAYKQRRRDRELADAALEEQKRLQALGEPA